MTVQEAYLKVKAKASNGNALLVSCVDFGSFWGFAFSDATDSLVGGGYDTVSKENGEVSVFSPTQNLKLCTGATSIPLELVTA